VSENLTLIWFFNPDCEYCTDIEQEVIQFARKKGARFQPVLAGIIDPESGEAQVPAIMYTHPTVKNHIFMGRFCLDALRYTLEHG
jgi:hypothetical protein